MPSIEPLVIIGTGLAGYTVAREWRALDLERPLLMLTKGDGAFYSKPTLSTALAMGKTVTELAMKSASTMAQELQAEIVTEVSVDHIDSAARTISFDGQTRGYGHLVIALGAMPTRLPVPGFEQAGVLSVNTLADYACFRDRLATATRIAVMGPGLIGCEFASDLLAHGKSVDVFGPGAWPLASLLPQPPGLALREALEEQGARFQLGTVAIRIEGTEQTQTVWLDNGNTIDANIVLSAVGLRPDIALAESAGLEVGFGIRTNDMLETSAVDIFALGDCAEVAGRHLPYVMPTMLAAKALAKTLAGTPTPVRYPAMPVLVKTLALPVIALPPPNRILGQWSHDGRGRDWCSTFVSDSGQLLGFALTGTATEKKQTLLKQIVNP